MLIFFAVGLAVYRPGLAVGAEKENPWKVSGSVGVQFDDNVNTSQVDDTSGQGDKATIIEGSGLYKIFDSKAFGLEAGYDYYQSLFEDLDGFDLQSHSVSLFASTELASLDLSAFYGYSRTLLGRNDFLSFNNFQPMVGFSATDSWYVSASYNYQNKNFRTVQERDANVHAGAVDNFFFFNEAKSFTKFTYRLQNENTRSAEFDFLGHYLKAELNTPVKLFTVVPKLKLSYQFSFKDYRSVTLDIGSKRLDKRHAGKASLETPLNEHASVNVDVEYIRALSNLKSSDFVEKVGTLSLKLSY
ncbi:MAG: hypothetical protein CMM60_01405 [Rhodospirillaceae bacterium]|nr:hypothetical protein [Rhodospirillaceae bacterium]